MKKQILGLVGILALSVMVTSCKNEHKTEEDTTIGQEVDSVVDNIEEAKDSAEVKIDSTVQDVKDAAKEGADAVEKAAKDAKQEVKDAADKVK